MSRSTSRPVSPVKRHDTPRLRSSPINTSASPVASRRRSGSPATSSRHSVVRTRSRSHSRSSLVDPQIEVSEIGSPDRYDPEDGLESVAAGPQYKPTPKNRVPTVPFLPKVTVTSAPGLGRTYNYKMGDTRVALLGAPSAYWMIRRRGWWPRCAGAALRCREIRVAVDFPTDCIASGSVRRQCCRMGQCTP